MKVVSQQLSVTDAARQHGYSRRQLRRLLARYRTAGLDAAEPRSRRPKSNPSATPHAVREKIITLRRDLTSRGLDAGPVTLAWHLEQAGLAAPSTSTVRRILHTAGLITPEPRKRPKSSYLRFEAAQPNETWQSDFTHWRLADGTDVEILNWLDDHSRYLLSYTAHQPVTGADVVTAFLAAVEQHGAPASTLTDNGRVYTARFGGGRNAFEYLLPLLGVRQKNGSPGHPQPQGKVERFHQTQKRYLAAQPPAHTIDELQKQLDQLREHYNENRPHRARERTTPGTADRATAKHSPPRHNPPATTACATTTSIPEANEPPHAGRMHHLGIGAAHVSSPSSTTPPSPSSTSTPAKSSRPTPSHPTRPTGETRRNPRPMAGGFPKVTSVATHV